MFMDVSFTSRSWRNGWAYVGWIGAAFQHVLSSAMSGIVLPEFVVHSFYVLVFSLVEVHLNVTVNTYRRSFANVTFVVNAVRHDHTTFAARHV